MRDGNRKKKSNEYTNNFSFLYTRDLWMNEFIFFVTVGPRRCLSVETSFEGLQQILSFDAEVER